MEKYSLNRELSSDEAEMYERINLKLENAICGTYFKEVLKAGKRYADTGKGDFAQEVDRIMYLAVIKSSTGNWFPNKQQIHDAEIYKGICIIEPFESELEIPVLTKYELKKINFILYVTYLVAIVHKLSVKDNSSKTPFKLIRFDFDSFNLQLGYTAFNENYTDFGMDLREILLSAQGESIEHLNDKWDFGKASDIAKGRKFDGTCKKCNHGYVIRDIFTGFSGCKTCERRGIFLEMGIILNDDVNADKADDLLKATCKYCGCDVYRALTFTKRNQKRFKCNCQKPKKDKIAKIPEERASAYKVKVKQGGRLSDDELELRAKKVNKNKGLIHTARKQYDRDPWVAEYTKRIANGICQLCKKVAPFINKSGEPYLENHHIIWLTKGGLDTVENTVALCPNCHRKMHALNDKKDVQHLLELKRNIV